MPAKSRYGPHPPHLLCNFGLVLLLVCTARAAHGAENDAVIPKAAETYAGVFAGAARPDNRIVDEDGFANWGNPGWSVDYGRRGFVAGALAGMKISAAGIPLRLELDGVFGNMSGNTNQLDPAGLDETVDSKFVWIASARAGVERALGTATVFVTGGVAVSRIANSVVDIDFGPDMPTQEDPDDSFRDRSTEAGWVIGAGIEVPLPGAWTLRLEGSHLAFGRETHRVNHSGGGRCGPGGVRKPCPYTVENKLRILRLAITRRFGR